MDAGNATKKWTEIFDIAIDILFLSSNLAQLYSLATLDKILWEAVKSGVACIGCKCGQCLKWVHNFVSPVFQGLLCGLIILVQVLAPKTALWLDYVADFFSQISISFYRKTGHKNDTHLPTGISGLKQKCTEFLINITRSMKITGQVVLRTSFDRNFWQF